jgi:hypothetical protein
MVSFWATEISETKAAIVKIPKGCVLNLCNVTSASYTPNEKSNVMSVGVETTLMDHSPWKGVIAHVGSGVNTYQVKIDLVFGLTSQVKFYLAKGCGKVNLSGYFQPGPSVVVDEAEEEEGNESKESSLLQQQQTLIKTKKRPREESTKEKTITWDQVSVCLRENCME